MPLRILLVEDEEELALAVQTVLSRQGHVVDHCRDGISGWELLSGNLAHYELAILDWMLPGLSGVDLCRRARARGLTVPLLLLTALGDTAHRVEGLDAGADDYLTKPFAMAELQARVRALQRRQPGYRVEELAWGAYRLNPESGRLVVSTPCGEVTLDLTGKERQLLGFFMERPAQLVSSARIRNQLWGLDADPVSNVVAAQVRLLRRRFEQHGLSCPIVTVPARGYRFEAPAAAEA